jgi:hypothetical protein
MIQTENFFLKNRNASHAEEFAVTVTLDGKPSPLGYVLTPEQMKAIFAVAFDFFTNTPNDVLLRDGNAFNVLRYIMNLTSRLVTGEPISGLSISIQGKDSITRSLAIPHRFDAALINGADNLWMPMSEEEAVARLGDRVGYYHDAARKLSEMRRAVTEEINKFRASHRGTGGAVSLG